MTTRRSMMAAVDDQGDLTAGLPENTPQAQGPVAANRDPRPEAAPPVPADEAVSAEAPGAAAPGEGAAHDAALAEAEGDVSRLRAADEAAEEAVASPAAEAVEEAAAAAGPAEDAGVAPAAAEPVVAAPTAASEAASDEEPPSPAWRPTAGRGFGGRRSMTSVIAQQGDLTAGQDPGDTEVAEVADTTEARTGTTFSGIQEIPRDPVTGLPVRPPNAVEIMAAVDTLNGGGAKTEADQDRETTVDAAGPDGEAKTTDADTAGQHVGDPEAKGPSPDAEQAKPADVLKDLLLEEKDELKDYTLVDALHAELMQTLMAPRTLIRDAINTEMRERVEQYQTTERLRQEALARAQQAQQNVAAVEAQAAAMAARGGGGRPGLLSGLFGSNPAKQSGKLMQRAVDEANRYGRELEGIEQGIQSLRQKGRVVSNRILGAQYKQMTDAGDAMYKSFARMDHQIGAFNKLFAESAKGQAYLKEVERVAGDCDLTMDEVRARVNDVADVGNADIVKLRDAATRLNADPEFAPYINAIERSAARAQREGDKLAEGMVKLTRNGMDLSAMEGLNETLEGMKPTNKMLLSKPGADGKDDRFTETMKKLAERLSETVRRIVEAIKAALGLGPAAASA